MNNNKDIRYLKAMLEFINDIKDISTRKPFDVILSEHDVELSAILMKLSQIGELVGRLSFDMIEFYPEVPWSKIKRMRNYIVHEYEKVDFDVLTHVIQKDLKDLENQLDYILKVELRKTRGI